ncbi:LysM peptidoglycan-binding domain-containing protein [Arthrobacter sp. NamB2]|uniref:LysM peptidoglycan-binding domain-containing protein n=1 Tax=Arthrobacter sp. NamB2 TaxID=2576035 RepID=UPI0010C98EFC|nr:LysM peptidoglycan-binding domain-containing protein [Arthrobacter sp. NamB2]TKV27984.1 LysM peptidoglycan-binding domain-containing protein [Arthrobacter sp. NamB2]
MAEAPVLQGSTALWAQATAPREVRLRLVTAFDQSSGGHSVHTGSDSPAEASPSYRTSTQRSAPGPLTLTRRGRLLLVGLPIALGVAVLILLGAFLTSQAQAGESAPASTATVEVNLAAGETLWDLAVQYAPHRDPRAVVAEMVELNDLRSSVVRAGQSISVPSESSQG